jgi:GxxExxY protein
VRIPVLTREEIGGNHQETEIQNVRQAEPIPAAINEISGQVVDAAFAVHRELGPRLLESVYEACLCHELTLRKMSFRSQVALPLTYKNLRLEAGLRLDLLVAESVIVELKSVQRIEPVFEAQLLSYLKLTGFRVGLLINFNAPTLKDGIYRFVV